MEITNSGTILFRNTMRITDGRLDGFRHAIARAVAFAQENGPQLMVEVFVDEERMLAYSFQLYRDSDSIRTHWRLSDPYIREVMEHCTVQHFEVFGHPDADIVAALKTPDGGSFPFSVSPRLAGFNRFEKPGES
ncbi:hypothetical protein ACH46N_22005 [Streptomyces pristinaespiralis]|uniref:ABM domain-containing protein n=2 Tax=Streptomyces pristinaespiralis TaxID=38300 RepID=B5HAW4_STRE2|nr:hypothetical protein [Streptomyces pristinaespiralis]ALC18372.1 hypothetical protein SPRI_0066 [Streptomyces pristinaespiralis]ALC25593.1 hypothetical protein SPRI_7287 [Streptomyces pristinaespiralis]EDY63975.1 conserved hypothetical protein [Streptomyces pristinaespiralis ATCC 25486]QMU12220.1 hypothetical protein H3L99_00305 [Streptomyces pristinaespiralis]